MGDRGSQSQRTGSSAQRTAIRPRRNLPQLFPLSYASARPQVSARQIPVRVGRPVKLLDFGPMLILALSPYRENGHDPIIEN